MADPDETAGGLRAETPVEPSKAARRALRLSSARCPSVAGEVHFRSGEREGRGVIQDISLTGAKIAQTTVRLLPSEEVELLFLMGDRRTKALASVVRQTSSGFAVRFLRIERELERLVLTATSDPDAR